MQSAAVFILGVICLLISTDAFIRTAARLSLRLGLSPLVVGVTLVALGTSLPELVVSAFAAQRGDGGLAFGNIIGSNIVNILLILPVGILFGNLRIGNMKTQRNTLVLLLVSVGFFFISRILPFPWIGGILILSAVLFTIEEYRWGVKGRNHEDKSLLQEDTPGLRWAPIVIQTILSLLGIIVGGVLTVLSVETISRRTGLSTTLLGFSLTAISTSLPELFATIFSSLHHEDKIEIGNILGSNIYNLLLIGGIATCIAGPQYMAFEQWSIFLLSSLLLAGIVVHYRGRTVPRQVGFGLLLLFALSMTFVIRGA